MTNPAQIAATLEALAAKATAGRLETAEYHQADYVIECPVCRGDGEVDASDYCNIDGKALGVQFYGIGSEFGHHEKLWSKLVNNLPTIIAALKAMEEQTDGE
jgi:RecJ-like exonuclease